MQGLLRLLHNNHVIQAGKYKDEKRKNELLELWKKLYGPGFIKAVVEDEPDGVKEDDGMLSAASLASKKSRFKKGSLPVKQKYYTNPRKNYSRYLD